MTNNELINEIIKYAQGMNCQADVFEWISKHFATQLDKVKIEQMEIEHIIDVSGKKSIAAAVGLKSIGKTAEDGCLALAWFDEKSDRPRLSVGYVGENIKANTWYEVDSKGNFVEVNNE